MNLTNHESLSRHTTLRTGGPALWFLEAAGEREILAALRMARKQQLPILVLGGGSNVLAADEGFDGLVIQVANRGIRLQTGADGATELVVAAGEEWDGVVAFATERELFGLENMSLIPGRTGGAVIGNIGAYGAEIKDTLRWAEAVDMRTDAVRRFSPRDCRFGYRTSFFKSPEGRNYIVTQAAFGLTREGSPNLRYRDVAEWFAGKESGCPPSAAQVREAVLEIRRRKMPDPAVVGTAGSFFKNPVIPAADYEQLAARYPGLPGIPEAHARVKVPLGWILDKVCGLRGAREGPVGTHDGQALVIVNGGGTAAQVKAFADHLAAQVLERTGIRVEWEVERVPAG